MFDTKNFSVTTINGYRRGNFTEIQAIRHALNLQKQMHTAGWAGKVHVFYRDGSEVKNIEERFKELEKD